MQRRWEPTNGYESSFQEALEIVLGCDGQWNEILNVAENQPEEKRKQFLGNALDTTINQFIQKNHECFVYDQKVKDQLLRSALGDLSAG